MQRYFGQLADFSSRSFTALNTAFVQDGAFIHVPDGVVVETPIHIMFVSGADGGDGRWPPAHADGRGRKQPGPDRRELHRRAGETYFANAVSEVFVGENAVRRSL